MYKIGVIGSGHRVTPLVKSLVSRDGYVLTAVCDIDQDGVKARYEGYENIHYYIDAKEMLDNEQLDGVFIGTRCSLHTHFALLVAQYHIPMFLEKPVCTNEEDLARLEQILYHNDKTVVSFPLRVNTITEYVKEIIDSGKLGRIEHVQAYNNVNYGRGYYHKWYKDESETGGLFLQKTTHDFDYLNYVLGNNKPVRICAMASKQIFKGDMPAGLKCNDCPKQAECPESKRNVETYGDPFIIGEECCFAVDTGNQDSGSAIVEYESGMHVVYSQNFFVRKKAGKRGARFMGYYGTVEFDFNTGVVTVYHHNQALVETHTFDINGNHFGGDAKLMAHFADVIAGKCVSKANLADGILSARMCLMAQKSADTHTFCEI